MLTPDMLTPVQRTRQICLVFFYASTRQTRKDKARDMEHTRDKADKGQGRQGKTKTKTRDKEQSNISLLDTHGYTYIAVSLMPNHNFV